MNFVEWRQILTAYLVIVLMLVGAGTILYAGTRAGCYIASSVLH